CYSNNTPWNSHCSDYHCFGYAIHLWYTKFRRYLSARGIPSSLRPTRRPQICSRPCQSLKQPLAIHLPAQPYILPVTDHKSTCARLRMLDNYTLQGSPTTHHRHSTASRARSGTDAIRCCYRSETNV